MKIVNNANGLATVEFVVGRLSLNDSAFAMLTIIFALISLDLAYLINNTFKKRTLDNEQFTIKRTNVVFAILIISTLFQSYLLFTGVTGFGNTLNNTSGWLSFIKMLSIYINPFALIISAYIIFIENNSSKKYLIIFYSMLAIQILTGFLSGMKEYTIGPILYVVFVFLIAGKKVPKNFIFLGLFFVALLYPINNAYRNVISNSYLNTGSSTLNMVIAIKKVATEPLSETLLGGVDSYSARGEMFPFLLYVINNEPRWDYYKNMTRYLAIPITWFVPSAVWEDKPKSDIGGVLYQLITGVRTATAVTPTSLGWAYLEGGVLFVFVIFTLIGLIFEFIDSQNNKKPIVLIFYITLFHLAIKPEWDPYFMMTSLIPMYIIYWGLLRFIGIQRSQL
jgi:hypothetical protein